MSVCVESVYWTWVFILNLGFVFQLNVCIGVEKLSWTCELAFWADAVIFGLGVYIGLVCFVLFYQRVCIEYKDLY